jgi:hypothetical protein
MLLFPDRRMRVLEAVAQRIDAKRLGRRRARDLAVDSGGPDY